VADSSNNSFGKPIPVLRVADVRASAKYYEEALGFKVAPWSNDSFASIAREDCSIFLTSDRQSQPRMWLWVGVPDVRALHAEYQKSGAMIRNPPNNFEWALEMQVEDLDGNVLRLGSDREPGQPLGVWLDADGVRWRHLGNEQYERLD
jgi:predicted lactoylglutathione lyase